MIGRFIPLGCKVSLAFLLVKVNFLLDNFLFSIPQ